jgi:uncharacterized metal-binding protein
MDNEQTTKQPLLFACAGGSSVGQLANEACRELTREGKGKLSCLAGIGGHIAGIVDMAKKADSVVAVDGCGVKCALKALEAAGVTVTKSIVLTDHGFVKDAELYPEMPTIKSAETTIMNNLKLPS